MLVINDEKFVHRAEIIREKGTNRSAFFRGEVDKYGWVDVGSSFLPSDIIAAFLYAQLENLDDIQKQRKKIWNTYFETLKPFAEKGRFSIPEIPEQGANNAHMFYIVCSNSEDRKKLLTYLKSAGIHAVFHYLSLHKSPFYAPQHDGRTLPHADHFSDCLVRLPFFYELTPKEQNHILAKVCTFFE